MAKRFKKQKAGQQAKKQRKPKPGSGSASSAGGAMSGMRGGFANMFGGGKGGTKTPMSKLLDVVLWIAVVIAGYYFVSNNCQQ